MVIGWIPRIPVAGSSRDHLAPSQDAKPSLLRIHLPDHCPRPAVRLA